MRRTNNNPWDLLGIEPGSTLEQIKRAFKKRALEVHPDRKNGDQEHFKLINDAYNKLKNNNLVPVLTSPQIKLVNLDLSMSQQIYGVDDIVEISNGESVKVKIPPGAVADDKIKAQTNGKKYILNIREKAEKYFTRQGFSLIMLLTVDIFDALVGQSIEITGPSEEPLTIVVPPGSTNDTIITLEGEGLFNRRTKKRGNLHVNINIKMAALNTDEDISNFITKLNYVRKNRKNSN